MTQELDRLGHTPCCKYKSQSCCRIGVNLCSMAFSIAAFAYVGVDITAAIALEARVDSKEDRRPQGGRNSSHIKPVRFVATWTSFIIWAIYFLAGIMLSFNVHWDNINLPLESFLSSPDSGVNSDQIKSNSGFVVSASLSNIRGLATLFTVIILLTVIFSANTNLYVASRSLFVLARKVNGENWHSRIFAWFGITNSYFVPVRAMLLSCCFLWVPFLYLSPHNSPDTTITSVGSLSSWGTFPLPPFWSFSNTLKSCSRSFPRWAQ